jgi:hypothetical protein
LEDEDTIKKKYSDGIFVEGSPKTILLSGIGGEVSDAFFVNMMKQSNISSSNASLRGLFGRRDALFSSRKRKPTEHLACDLLLLCVAERWRPLSFQPKQNVKPTSNREPGVTGNSIRTMATKLLDPSTQY